MQGSEDLSQAFKGHCNTATRPACVQDDILAVLRADFGQVQRLVAEAVRQLSAAAHTSSVRACSLFWLLQFLHLASSSHVPVTPGAHACIVVPKGSMRPMPWPHLYSTSWYCLLSAASPVNPCCAVAVTLSTP